MYAMALAAAPEPLIAVPARPLARRVSPRMAQVASPIMLLRVRLVMMGTTAPRMTNATVQGVVLEPLIVAREVPLVSPAIRRMEVDVVLTMPPMGPVAVARISASVVRVSVYLIVRASSVEATVAGVAVGAAEPMYV